MREIGFIGLGAMGSRMVQNLLTAGYNLHVYDQNPDRMKQLDQPGVHLHQAPRGVSASSAITFVMVPDDDALYDVLYREQGLLEGLRPGGYVVNVGTVSHETTVTAADAVRQLEGRFIDAPVSGSIGSAAAADLAFLVAGSGADIKAVTPALKTMGGQIIRCGPVGQGTRMKLTENLLMAGTMQVLAETLVFGAHQGLDPDAVMDVVATGPLYSMFLEVKGDRILEGNFESAQPVNLLFKDMELVLDAAGHAGLPLPATAAARESVTTARALGHGNDDMAAIVRALEHQTGRTVRRPRKRNTSWDPAPQVQS